MPNSGRASQALSGLSIWDDRWRSEISPGVWCWVSVTTHSAAFVISLPGLCLLRATGERLPSAPLSKPNVFPLIPHFQTYPVIPLLLWLQLDLPVIFLNVFFFLKQDAVTLAESWSLQRRSGLIRFISAARLAVIRQMCGC